MGVGWVDGDVGFVVFCFYVGDGLVGGGGLDFVGVEYGGVFFWW